MNTNKKNGEDFFLDITYLRCFMALKIIKDEFGIETFKQYRHILSDIMQEYHLWKSINDKEFLSRIDLENEIENPKLTNLINEVDLCYASCDRIYDFSSTEIIPYSDRRYFLLITICLNNFNDENVEKILAYQFSIYPNKENFLKNLRLTVREHADKIIPYHKAQTVIEWIKVIPPEPIGTDTEQPKPQAAQDKRKRGRPQIIEEDFPKYLTVILQDKFAIHLKEKFKDSNAKEIVYMVLALKEMNKIKIFYNTEILRALNKYFGKKICSKTNFNNHANTKIPKLGDVKKIINTIITEWQII